jgi:MFS family permease
MSEMDLEILRAEVEASDYSRSKDSLRYSWIVLLLLLSVQISNQWQRLVIGPAYYFEAEGKTDDPKYSLRAAIPNFTDAKYGILAGPTFTLVYATLILFTGLASDKYSRRLLFSIAGILWSLTSIGTSVSHTLGMISLNRIMLGVFEAFAPPAAYSLVADYFPPNKRTTANAVLSLGVFVGAGLASVTTIMIGLVGWRQTYFYIGCFGILVAIVALLFIKDP